MSNVLCIRSLQLCKICTLLSYVIGELPKYAPRMQRATSKELFQCFELIYSIFFKSPVDITIEQTSYRYAKSQGGIIRISRKYAAYYRCCMTRHFRAQYVEATLQCTEMSNDVSVHQGLNTSQIRSSDQDVKS